MQKLVAGVHAFRQNYFARHRRLFEQLAEHGQRPEALFITCSDSRVMPAAITDAAPGDLFIVRNIGNIVPPDERDLWGGVASAIEYAVEVLSVSTIIVCGHTQCGAMQAIVQPEPPANLPRVAKWLAPTRERLVPILAERYADRTGENRLTLAVQENVLIQLEHLRTFPFVAERLEKGTLQLSGWVFKIATGEVFDYDPETQQFVAMMGGGKK